MGIVVNGISFVFPDGEELFRDVTFSLARGSKASLVGNNGTGKSTLLGVIAGREEPAAGNIEINGATYMVPQHYGQYDDMTIAQVLNVDDKIRAFKAILAGDMEEKNYSVLDDDWLIEQRTIEALAKWGLGSLGPDTKMEQLSGGEKTKVFLSGIDIHSPEIILMDEPTNHLDYSTREQLYGLLTEMKATMLIVSHDRHLLNLMGTTLELTRNGIVRYGGNYDFYKEQYELKLGALVDRISDRQKTVRDERKTAMQTIERKQKSDSRGEKKHLKEGIPRIMMNSLRDGAEKSTTRLKDKHRQKIEAVLDEITQLKDELPDLHGLKIELEQSYLHKGKILVDAREVDYCYDNGPVLWKKPIDLQIKSGDRIAIQGKNGSGKTTLLRLLTGQLNPTVGTVFRSDFSYLYIDQQYSLIKEDIAVIRQVEQWNSRNMPDHLLRTELARFLFPVDTWDKKCGKLSGGEKMRLALCCMVVSEDKPGMIILDEPTNNLDLRSMDILTSAIKGYDGTLLVISHDRVFIEQIGTNLSIDLDDLP